MEWMMRRRMFFNAVSDFLRTVSGALPLILTNAVNKAIHSLTRYGLCVQNGTPTPYASVDIMCNNGAIKVSRNLCDVVSANIVVGQYIDNSGTARNDSANFFYAPLIPVDATKTYTMHTSASLAYFSVMEYDSSRGFIRRDLYGTSSVAAGDTITFTVSADCAFIRFGSNIKKSAISEANVLAIDWMLTQTATAQDFRPYGEIYVGGTHPGQNLVDLTAVTDGYYYDQNGVYATADAARLTDYIPVRAGQKYTVYAQAAQSGLSVNVRCNLFDTGKVWKSQSVFVVAAGNSAVSTITPTENGFLRVSANYTGTGAKVDWSTFQIVQGEYTLATMPPYEPYEEIPYTPEVLTVSGKNLFDNATMRTINPMANFNNVVYWGYRAGNAATAIKIHVKPNTTYTLSYVGGNRCMIGGFINDVPLGETKARACDFTIFIGESAVSPKTFTTPNNCNFVCCGLANDSGGTVTNIQLELGTAATDYKPYVTPQTVGWKNLFDASSYTEINAYVNANTGVLTTGSPGSMTQYCAVIPCKPNTQYNITGQGTSAWGAFTSDSIGTTATAYTKGGNLTTGSNDRYLIGLVRANGDVIDYRNTLVVRETVTDIPMLLGVGDYKDEIELVGGLLTHKVGIKVLTGGADEIWGYSQTSGIDRMNLGMSDMLPANYGQGLCTHLKRVSSVAEGIRFGASNSALYVYLDPTRGFSSAVLWKAFLAAQYAAGTPIIVVYPLATETTEQTTPQHLVTHKGTNVVEASANVSPITAEIQYYSSEEN